MNSLLMNPILKTDSYKPTQWCQYPPRTEDIYSYIEARGTKIEGVDETVFFGLQPRISSLLMTRITMADVEAAKSFIDAHIGPNIFHYEGWKYVVERHGGYLPLEIRAVPEGTVVPNGNLVVAIHSLDPKCYWAVSYIETALLQSSWYGSTVATLSRHIKKTIKKYLDLTATDPDNEIMFKLHDFGFRGVSSDESAGHGGAGHLVNFYGTDTIEAITYAMEHYNAGMCGFSIPASEHSTMTSWTREREYDAYANMVEQFPRNRGSKLFACVIDSYDTFNALKLWALPQNGNKSLIEQVKELGATIVLRPDSGDPVATPVQVIEMLMDLLKDEVYVNNKGFLVLPDHVRVIQGDGIDHKDVEQILATLHAKGISASNIAFGMGGGLLQKVNRDTFKYAMKASAGSIGGSIVDIYKDPVTDPGKKSKRGVLELYRDDEGNYSTRKCDEVDFDGMRYHDKKGKTLHPATRVVYTSYRGNITTNFISFDQVRENAAL